MRSERPKRDGSKSEDPSFSFACLDPGIGVMEMQVATEAEEKVSIFCLELLQLMLINGIIIIQ